MDYSHRVRGIYWRFINKAGQGRTSRDKPGQAGTSRDKLGQAGTSWDKPGQAGTRQDKGIRKQNKRVSPVCGLPVLDQNKGRAVGYCGNSVISYYTTFGTAVYPLLIEVN